MGTARIGHRTTGMWVVYTRARRLCRKGPKVTQLPVQIEKALGQCDLTGDRSAREDSLDMRSMARRQAGARAFTFCSHLLQRAKPLLIGQGGGTHIRTRTLCFPGKVVPRSCTCLHGSHHGCAVPDAPRFGWCCCCCCCLFHPRLPHPQTASAGHMRGV